MKDYLNAVLDTITGMPSATLISGLILSLFLALPMAWAYAGCRRKESENDAEATGDARTMPLVVLAMVTNLIGMAAASGYSTYSYRSNRGIANISPTLGAPGSQRSPATAEGRAMRITRDIFEGSDVNNDGLLSVDEATQAAAALIRTTAGEGKDTIDAQALSDALQKRLTPPNRR